MMTKMTELSRFNHGLLCGQRVQSKKGFKFTLASVTQGLQKAA